MKPTNIKYSLCLLELFCNLSFLNGQIQKLANHQVVSYYQLDLVEDTLILLNQSLSPPKDNKLLRSNAYLSDNELIINYQLDNPGKQGYYYVDLEIILNKEPIEPNPGYLLGDLGTIQNLEEATQQIIWTNIIRDLPEAQGELQLALKVEWWGVRTLPYDVDCNQYPRFAFREKRPFYAGLLGGVGAIATGVIIKNNAQKHFDYHLRANTLSERQQEYRTYTSQLQTAEWVTYAGIGIIAVDAVFYFLRKEKYKKRLEIFEEYCGQERLSIGPTSEGYGTGKTKSIGLQILYQF